MQWLLLAGFAVGSQALGLPPVAQIESVYPQEGSCFGGTMLVIQGSGFQFPTWANPWDAQAVFVGTVPCKIVPHYTASDRIVCKTGAATPFTDQNNLAVSVQIFAGLGGVQTVVKTNAFSYKRSNTPFINWASQWGGSGGDVIKFQVDVDRNPSSSHFFDVYIGPEAMCQMDQEAYPLDKHDGDKLVRCTLPDSDFLVPGFHNVSMRLNALDKENDPTCPNAACFPFSRNDFDSSRGYGIGEVVYEVSEDIGRVNRVWAGTVDLASGTAHHFVVHPEVKDVEPHRGGVYGGNVLTITGHSFSPSAANNKVTVGGVPCDVLAATSTTLECTLRASVDYTLQNYRTARGTRVEYFDYSGSFSNAPSSLGSRRRNSYRTELENNEVDFVRLTDFRDKGSGENTFLRDALTFFVAPLTANYSFYVAGDDVAQIEISSDSSFDNLQVACHMEQHMPFSRHHPIAWWYRLDRLVGPFQGPSTPVSHPIELEAGQRYAMRMVHYEGYGDDYLRVAMKVSSVSTAVNASGVSHSAETVSEMLGGHPAMELQMVRMQVHALREQVEVVINDVTQTGGFRLILLNYAGLEAMILFTKFDLSAKEVREAIMDAAVYDSNTFEMVPIINPDRCGSSSAWSEDTGNQRRIVISFNCPLRPSESGWVQDMSVVDMLLNPTTDVTVGKVQNASQGVGGTFRVGFDGMWSDDINARGWEQKDTLRAVRNIRRLGSDAVELEAWPCIDCWNTPEFWEFYVRFREPRGNVPELELDTSLVTGEGIQFFVQTIEDGDADAVFLERLPMDFFEQPYTPVAREPCSPSYGVDYSVTADYFYGSDMLMSGGRVGVRGCAALCDNIWDCVAYSVHRETGDCSLYDASGASEGENSTTDDSFATCGGAVECAIDEGVTIGAETCTAMTTGLDGYIYLPCNGAVSNCDCCRRTSVSENRVPVRVVSRGITGATSSLASFSFSQVISPLMLDVSPTTVSMGTEVSFSVAGLISNEDVIVSLGDKVACVNITLSDEDVSFDLPSVTHGLESGDVVLTPSVLVDVYTCIVTDGIAGEHDVFMISGIQGKADPSTLGSVLYEPSIVSLLPASGSIVGGTLIVMEGDGLIGLPCSTIMVGGLPCSEPSTMGIVPSHNMTDFLSCLTPAYSGYDAAAAWNPTQEETVDVTISFPASMAATVRAQFTFKAAETPEVATVSPTEMSAAVSAFVSFTGSSFIDAAASDDQIPKIRIGSRFCGFTEDDFADDFLKCWFPRASAGVPVDPLHDVTVWLPAWGFARATADISIVSEFELQSVSPQNGSLAGGTTVTLAGRGFHPFDATKNHVTLMLTDGTQHSCTILTGSYTEITCMLEGGTPLLGHGSGRRLLATEKSRSADLCKTNAADSAKGHCLAREIHRRGGLKRHHHADLTHFDKTVGHLAYNHPGDHEFLEEHCEEDAEGILTCSAPAAVSSGTLKSKKLTGLAAVPTDDVVGPFLPQLMMRRLEAVYEPSFGPSVGPSVGPPSSGPDFPEEEEEEFEHLSVDMAGYMLVSIAGVPARCVNDATNCSFAYLVNSSYKVLNVAPLNGSFYDNPNITISMSPPVSDIASLTVYFGETTCPILSSYASLRDGESTTELVVPLCAFKASTVPIYVYVNPLGYALDASPQTGSSFNFVQELQLHSVSPLSGSACGGTELTIAGAGFGATAEENLVTIGWKSCEIISASFTELRCYSPSGLSFDTAMQTLQVEVPNLDGPRRTGFLAEFFPGSQSGTFMDPFAPASASITRTDATISYTDSDDFPYGSNFQARWSAWLYIDEPGMYTFTLESDDGSVLYISDNLIVDNGGYHDRQTRAGTLYLAAGRHLLTAQFFQGSGSARMILRYQGPDTEYALQMVPAAQVEPVSFADAAGAESNLPSVQYSFLAEFSSPQISDLTVTSGALQVTGSNFGASTGLVAFGTASKPDANLQCTVTSWSDSSVDCNLPDPWPAGEWSVRVWTSALGWSCPFHRTILSVADVTSVEMHGVTTNVVVGDRWVPIMKSDGSDTWGYDAALWEDDNLLSETVAFEEADNAKYEAFLITPFRRIRMCVGSPEQNCVEHSFAREWSSAKELFSAGEIRDLSVQQQAMLRSFGAQKGEYRECPMQEPGFNVKCGGNKARWGYCANCANQPCQSHGADADATIGLGLIDEHDNPVGAGWTYMFNSGVDTDSCAGTQSAQAVWVWVEDLSSSGARRLSGSLPELELGYGGGLELTLTGSGLGTSVSDTVVTVCGSQCPVTKVGTGSVTCVVPPLVTEELLDAYPLAFPVMELARSEHVARFYTDQGEIESLISQAAYTSPVDEPVKIWESRSACWFGFELDPRKLARVESVAFFPPTNPTRRYKVRNSVFEVMNLTNGSWVQVMTMEEATITGSSIQQGWNSFVLEEVAYAQAFRVRILPDACSSSSGGRDMLRGVRFYGNVFNADPSGACDLEVSKIMDPLASAAGRGFFIPATIAYSVARTPVIENLSPNRGTARGGTEVELSGQSLMPVDASGADELLDVATDFVVNFNSYACPSVSVDDSTGVCSTSERFAINPPSTSVWIKGKGFALLGGNTSERTTFRYIDKWSNPFSWLDSELPVEGDSVIVPEGQAILLDQDSPILYFVMISGWMEFDRKDLHFQATYLWVAGGQLSIGSEEEPFLHQATITMHGDRWHTIELPFIGNKMVAVTNLGGLHGGCHVKTTNSVGRSASPCPVDSVGKLDIHGRPASVAWTRIVETASPGDVFLSVAEPVDWLVGSRVVITPSHRGNREEERYVKSVSNDGYTIELDKPLSHEHLGTWYHHDAIEPIDLRAAVGLMSKNVMIKGDDDSWNPGNSYLYGAHVGAFFGGQMRIENTEFTQTGQAANFGRYSSHWHVLGVGRNADVVDTAYLRNNSYHDTFQRAVVVHSTDYTVVRDNVAVRTHGHSFFTETGDEDFALFEHNLAVRPLPHHLLLDDDQQPAGFWLPGFMGWHRNNMAAGCVRGWRLRKLSHVNEGSSKLIFYNNSAHASGHGWHLKPPHAPATLQNFRTFTTFRCGMGMFYYSTGNIFHDDHKFVECGTGFHMNHLSNNVNTAPFFHDLVVVGNINDNDPTSRTGRALSGPKDNEYFFTSGATIINMYNSAAFRHCWDTMCTVRYERVKWFNSNKRTQSDWGLSGIFHDLDGTLTGYKNGFVTWNAPFLHFPECEVVSEHAGGIVCGQEDGELRVRRNYVYGQEPWQLDGKQMMVQTRGGSGYVPFAWQKLYGWAVPSLTGYEYDMRINDPNDFQQLSLSWSVRSYTLDEWGYVPDELHHRELYMDRPYTHYYPMNETAKIHLNYTDWRDHFDQSSAGGTRLKREPEFSDRFGSFAMKLWEHQCNLYNLSSNVSHICSGNYTDYLGIELKDELDDQPLLEWVTGRLTYVVSTKVNDGNYIDTPTGLTARFQARECPDEGCPTPPPPVFSDDEDEAGCRKWSDASGWPGGALPAFMDNTEIPADDCVVLDTETPTLHVLTIIGRLAFSRKNSSTLNAYSVKVWGAMEVGTPERPIPANVTATVALWGDEIHSNTVIMIDGLFLVNKVVSVLGSLTAAGAPIDAQPWTRLSSTASIGDVSIVVDGNCSAWPVGKTLGIAATEYPSPPDSTETEVRTIVEVTYDEALDQSTIVLDQPLQARHFAGTVMDSDDGGHWKSVVLKAPVSLLGGRSNVVFKTGEDDSLHGGYINVGGSPDGVWIGHANISNVDMVRLGKHLYQQPALKFNFLGSSGRNIPEDKRSRIVNTVFSYSQSGAIELNGASHVEIANNVFHRTYRTAVWLASSCQPNTITIEGNMALETLRFPLESTSWVRPFAAYLIEVQPKVLYGNVAAGSADSGFVLRPQMQPNCANNDGLPMLEPEQVNEAIGCLTGLFILRASGSPKACLRVHGFRIWKSAHIGIVTADQGASVRLDTMVLSDNHMGIAMGFVGSSSAMVHRVYIHNMTIFGSTPASVCGSSEQCKAITGNGPAGIKGMTCGSVLGSGWRRAGIVTHVVQSVPKLCEANPKLRVCRPPNTPVKMCVMPWEKRIGSQGARYAETHLSSITFGYFKGNDCGMKSAAFTVHPSNPDFNFPYFFSDVKWLGNTVDDAGRFDLSIIRSQDSYHNLMIVDRDGTLLESGAADGSVVPFSNPALAIDSCIGKPAYYSCPLLKLRMLTWQPVGSPPERVLGSMKLWREGDGRATWSSGPVKATCLPGDPPALRQWAIQPDMNYNMTLFASSPKHHRIYYYNDDPEPIRIALFLSQPFRIEVYKDGELLDESVYDTSQCCETPRYPTREDPHGSYAFDPHQRRVYFTMWGGKHGGIPSSRGGGHLFLRAMQVVQLSLTMSVGIREFDGDAVVNNVATLLQIPASRIRIVSVQSNAQVEAQGGRRLVKRWINPRWVTGGRRLTEDNFTNSTEEDANQTELTIQIIEENPEPLDESLLASGFDEDDASSFNLTVVEEDEVLDEDGNFTSDNDTNISLDTALGTEFDEDAAAELTAIADALQTYADSGDLGEALGAEVEVTEVTSTDIETVDVTATTTTTTTSTSTSTASSTTSSGSSAFSVTSTSSTSTSNTQTTTSTSTATSTSTSTSESSGSSSTSSVSTASSASSRSSSSTTSSSSTSTMTTESTAATLTSTTSSSTSTSSTASSGTTGSSQSSTSTSASSLSSSSTTGTSATSKSSSSTSSSTGSAVSAASSTSTESTTSTSPTRFTLTSSTSTSTTRFTATSSTSTSSSSTEKSTLSSTSTSESSLSTESTFSSTSASSASTRSTASTSSTTSTGTTRLSASSTTSTSTSNTASSTSTTTASSTSTETSRLSQSSTTSTSTSNTASSSSSSTSSSVSSGTSRFSATSSTSTSTSNTETTTSTSSSTSKTAAAVTVGSNTVNRYEGTMRLTLTDVTAVVGNTAAIQAIENGIAAGINGVDGSMVTVTSITQVQRRLDSGDEEGSMRQLTASSAVDVAYRIDVPTTNTVSVAASDVSGSSTSIQAGIEAALASAGVAVMVTNIDVPTPTATVVTVVPTTLATDPPTTVTPSSTGSEASGSSGSDDKEQNTAALIAVGVAAFLMVVCMCAGGFFLWRSSNRRKSIEKVTLVDAFVAPPPSDNEGDPSLWEEYGADDRSPTTLRQVAHVEESLPQPRRSNSPPPKGPEYPGPPNPAFSASLAPDLKPPKMPGGISPSSDC